MDINKKDKFELDKLKFFLKFNNINYLDFDYIEGETADEILDKKPYIIKYCRYYQNPILWRIIFNMRNAEPAIGFFNKNILDVSYNLGILNNLVSIENENNFRKYVLKAIKNYLSNSNNENVKADLDQLLYSVLLYYSKDDLNRFKKIVCIAKELNIEPMYDTYGNVGRGSGILEVIKTGKLSAVKKLVEVYGADPKLNNSMCIATAAKYGFYTIVIYLIEKGADKNTKNNLVLKLIKRNDSIKMILRSEDKKSKTELLKLYE